jgi:hypothetical protein
MPAKEPEKPKRDLALSLESAHRLRTFLAPLDGLPDVIEAALEAETRQKAADAAVRGLENQRVVLTGEITSLEDKAQQARLAADTYIAQAAKDQRAAEEALRTTEAQAASVAARLSTDRRLQEKELDDEQATRVHEREQEIARIEGLYSNVKAKYDAFRASIGLPADPELKG